MRNNKSFESLKNIAALNLKASLKDQSPSMKSKESSLPRQVSSPLSPNGSIASKDKMMSARPYVTESSDIINVSLPFKKKTSDPNTFSQPAKQEGLNDTQETPVRIGPINPVFNESKSDLISPASIDRNKQSGTIKIKGVLNSNEKLASIVARNTESKKKLTSGLAQALEKHRKSDSGNVKASHERLNSGISHKDTPRMGLNLEDSMECYIESVRDKKKSTEEHSLNDCGSPFNIPIGLKKKNQKGVVLADRKLTDMLNSKKTSNNSSLKESKKRMFKSGDFPSVKKFADLRVDLYKEDGHNKHYIPNLKQYKKYEALISEKKTSIHALNSSNQSSRRRNERSNERSRSGSSLKSMSLQFTTTTNKKLGDKVEPSYSSSIYA